jgi:hypothetical protein
MVPDVLRPYKGVTPRARVRPARLCALTSRLLLMSTGEEQSRGSQKKLAERTPVRIGVWLGTACTTRDAPGDGRHSWVASGHLLALSRGHPAKGVSSHSGVRGAVNPGGGR